MSSWLPVAAGVRLAGADAPARALAELAHGARAMAPLLGVADHLGELVARGASALTRATLDDAQARTAAALARSDAPAVEQPAEAGPPRGGHRLPVPPPRPRRREDRTRDPLHVPTPAAAGAAMPRLLAELAPERPRASASTSSRARHRRPRPTGASAPAAIDLASGDRTLDAGRASLLAHANGLAALADRVPGGRVAAALAIAPAPIVAQSRETTVASPAAHDTAPRTASPISSALAPSARSADAMARALSPAGASPVARSRRNDAAPAASASPPRTAAADAPPARSAPPRSAPPSPGVQIVASAARTVDDDAPSAPRGLARLVSLWQQRDPEPPSREPAPPPMDDASLAGLGSDDAITRVLERVLRHEARRHGIPVDES